MFQCHAKSLLAVLLVFTCIKVHAQTTTSGSNPLNGKENNPYTKYGIGELANGNNAVLKGMGNITSGYASPYNINTDNPASYSFLQRTTFDVSAVGSTRTINSNAGGTDYSYKTGTASVAQLTIGVPINKSGGFVFGFKPYSHIYYSLVDSVNENSTPPSPIGSAVMEYKGEGSMDYAFVGGSAKYKGLSAGFNLGYLFGTISNKSTLYPIDGLATNNAFRTEFSNYTRVGGVQWKGGLQYEKKLDSLHYVRVGGTITLGQQIRQHYSEYHISSFSFGDTITRDTSYNITNLTGALTLPLSYSAGVIVGREGKWSAGIDYTATDWTTFSSELNPLMNKGVGTSSYRVSVGGDYTPDPMSVKRYLSRVTYRLGAYYGDDYLKVNGIILPNYGITAGASLPFRRSLSHIHVAIDGGTIGSTQNNLTKQNYVRFTLGVSLNDLWFVKRHLE